MVVLISVVYYSEWRERGGEGGQGGRGKGVRGGVLGWRRRSAVMRETEGTGGDQESGREDRRRRRGRRRWPAGGGCLPPLNPLVLALNMIQMLSSLLFRSPVSHPTAAAASAAAAATAAAAHEPRATILTPPPPSPSIPGLVLRFRTTATHTPVSLSRGAASSADLFPRLTRG